MSLILLLITDREELRRSASWTLSGIVLPEDRSRGRTKPSLSKRMQSLVDSQKRRILVFRNGESSEGVEIVAGRFDEVQINVVNISLQTDSYIL